MAHRAVPVIVLAVAVLLNASCRGVLGPSCTDEFGDVFRGAGVVALGDTRSFTVVSPKDSNLVIRLTWTDSQITLAMSATMTDCGTHVGCTPATIKPAPGPGASSPNQPWPAGVREMLVDGSRGKTWRIDVTGDAEAGTSFTLAVTYKRVCES